MKHVTIRSLTATAAATVSALLLFSSVATVGVLAATSGTPASASTVPPWEPDANSVGGLIFYNSSGVVITGGSTTATPIAAYVEGTKTVRAGDTKATLYGYLPVKGESPGEWSGEQITLSSSYPNSSAPDPVKNSTLPVVTGVSGDETIAQLAIDFPNADTSSDGYAGMYVLRLKTSGPDEGSTVTYDSADIQITGSTWSVVYTKSGAAATTTALAVAPATPVAFGAAVKLTATVSPTAAAGTVRFFVGATLLKTVTAVAGKAVLSTRTLPGGADKLTARFVPSNTSAYLGSTSVVHTLTVRAAKTTTTLKASALSIKKGQKETLVATVAPVAGGTVSFFDGAKKLGVVNVTKGKAVFSTTTLAVGTQSLKAIFKPSSAADDTSSTSKVVKITVRA